MRILLFGCLLLACVPVAAQGVEVGAQAPEITSSHWINPPVFRSFEDLRGDVVLIKAWGKN